LRGQQSCVKKPASHREQYSRERNVRVIICLRPDRIEQMPKQQRPEHISKRERQKITTDVFSRHAIEPHQHKPHT